MSNVLTREQVERFDESDCPLCHCPVPLDASPGGVFVRYAELAEREATIVSLKERLEMDYGFDAAGNRVACPGIPDGIECRDATIDLIERANMELKARIIALEATVKDLQDQWHYAATCDGDLDYVEETRKLTARLAERDDTIARLIDDGAQLAIGFKQTLDLNTALQARITVLEATYHELIYAVSNKWPTETRHQTALRYIQERENTVNGPAQQAALLPREGA